VILDEVSDEYLLLGEDFDLFVDTLSVVPFKDLSAKEDLFTSDHELVEIIHETGANYWMRFNFIESDTTEKKILEVITPQTEHLVLYVPKQGGGYDRFETGYLQPYREREYDHKNFIFDFQKNTDFSRPFYLKMHSSNKVALLMKVRSQKYFTAYSLKEYFSLGYYYGILSLLILYNLFIFVYVRKPVYIAYSFVVLFSIGLSMSDDGLGFAFIWSNHPSWSQALGLDVFPMLFMLAYSVYATEFLDEHGKKLRKPIWIATGVYVLFFLFELIFSSEKFYYSFAYSLPFIVIYFTYWYAVIKLKFRAGRFFIVGNSFALVGLVIEQLRLLEVIEGTVFTVYAFEMGIVLEFISLSLSLAYRYAKESKALLAIQKQKVELLKATEKAQIEKLQALEEKEELSQKVNRELEQKVQERTVAVQEANDKLQLLVDNLESMSITLDKENWQLKKVIKEEKKSRLTGGKVTLEEVRVLFPTKISCLEFLERLKWEKSYSCAKCGYEKASLNQKDLSRKCSKCGKIESVTAGSLFHSQKIPLQVLFLLTHLTFDNRELDVRLMADKTEVSENSIYRFIAKVKARKEERNQARSWEDIIY
jgi:hypothetical protein